MTEVRNAAAAVLALGLLLGGTDSVLAQQRERQHRVDPGMGEPGGGMMQQGQGYGSGPGITGPWHLGPHMMSPDEMQEMTEHTPGGMGHGHFGPGVTGPGTGPRTGGWLGLEGRRVVPMIQLSPDDVRGFLERYLAALGNDRLKVGEVTVVDDDTITAEVVTVDDSLVESFEVDRHTGVISAAG